MEDPINEGCYPRHPKTTSSQNTSNFISSTPEEITLAEENFLLGVKCLREDKFNDSIEYFKKSAKDNCENAEYNLGVIYEYGVSAEIPRDLDKAKCWYQRAKNNGHIEAKKALDRVIEKQQSWFYFFG